MEENYLATSRNGHELRDMYNPETNTLDIRSNGHYPSNVLSKTRGSAKLFCRHAAWNFLPTCVITVQNQFLLANGFRWRVLCQVLH